MTRELVGRRETAAVSIPTSWPKEIGKASYAFTTDAVTADRKAYLRGLPRESHIDLAGRRVSPGSRQPATINEYLLRDRDPRTYDRLAGFRDRQRACFGHTHEFWSRDVGGVLFVNVGSVGRPKDGDPRAGYAILRVSNAGAEAGFVRVTYDTEAVATAIASVGLPAALAEGIRSGR